MRQEKLGAEQTRRLMGQKHQCGDRQKTELVETRGHPRKGFAFHAEEVGLAGGNTVAMVFKYNRVFFPVLRDGEAQPF